MKRECPMKGRMSQCSSTKKCRHNLYIKDDMLQKYKKTDMPKKKEIKKKVKPYKDCCWNNVDKAVRLGRANYACPKCKRDVSLMWAYYQEAVSDL